MTPLPVRILGVGVHEPGRLVTSAEVDLRLGKASGWSERTTGVRVRRYAAADAGETASLMGESAARRALAMAGLPPEGLSAVLGACGVMEQPIPGTSVLIHRRLGLGDSGTPAFDVNASCLGFLPALQIAAMHIACGLWSRVLVVGSDLASAALDLDDPSTAPLFGDGAAAVVLGSTAAEHSSALLACRFETYSEGADAAWLGAGGSRLPARDLEALLAEAAFRMDGPAAYRLVAPRMPRMLDALLADAETRLDDVSWIVPHQASGRALDLMVGRLGLRPERVVRTIQDHGNQVAASLPFALASAILDGRVQRGHRVLLLGSGAGVSLAGAVLTY